MEGVWTAEAAAARMPAHGSRATVSVLTVSTFLALLALLAAGVTAIGLVLVAIDAVSGGSAVLARIRGAVGPYGLWLAWLVAATAMAGSLYLSEVAGFIPCALCWYQRIAMYPMAILLLIAAVRGDRGIRPYGATLALIGAAISGYHVLVQRLPGLPSGSCSIEAPCTAIYVERFGFVTIPVMALIGFLTIATVLLFFSSPPPAEAEVEA
jgi:disulfide bond formation protein DsbB